jgi:hypothetical protein
VKENSLSEGRDRAPADEPDPASSDPEEEMIDEASEESFPASDSPSSWSGPPTETR